MQTQTNYRLLSNYRLDPRKVKVLFFQQGKRNIDFAQLTGIHPVTVSRHIMGYGRNPKIQQALAEYLGVSLEAIVQTGGGHRRERAA